jgi:phage terminase large subunit-like protein
MGVSSTSFPTSDYRSVSHDEYNNLLNYVEDIIDNLPPEAIQELSGGKGDDLEVLVNDMMIAAHEVFHNNNNTIKSYGGLSNFEKAFDDSMKIMSYNYFKTTMLPNFIQGWRNLEWGNLMQLNPWSAYLAARSHGKSYEFCFATPLWRLWRYRKPNFIGRDSVDNRNSKDTVVISNESKLVKIHLGKISEEIKSNDLLREDLFPEKGGLGIEKLRTKNGATVDSRSFGSAIRGLHVGTVLVDDFLDKSAIYSSEQRQKFHEVFYAEIKAIVEPYGNLWVSGTPFHSSDLYNDLKNDHMFKVFEYPAIYPNGKLLSPDRFNFKQLMDLKKSLGSIIFAREYLVSPISDASSLFPYAFLNKSIKNMSNIGLVSSIENYPIKMERVTVGCDFAISGNIASDFSVFTVWGRGIDKKYYLIGFWRAKGASHNEQVSRIVQINNNFKPNVIYAENNGFQRILIEMAKERGIENIEPFTTTSNIKKDWYEGLPSLSALFERGEIRIPYKEGESKNTADLILGEFNSISFNEDNGKLESVGGHDDCAMSSFFAITDLRENISSDGVVYI